MKDNIEDRFKNFVKQYGEHDILAHMDRRDPPDKNIFIERLYTDIHDILEGLQKQAHELVGEGETSLRSRLVTSLRTLGFKVSSESDHRGHTDILVESSKVRLVWIGETKKHEHSGNAPLTDGMNQLHTRYMSGVHRDAGLIVFVFNKNAARVMTRWRSLLEKSQRWGIQAKPQDDDEIPLSFWTEHIHEGSGLPVRTKHIFAALYYNPEK